MSLDDLLVFFEEIPIVQEYVASYFWYPFIESAHVVSVAFVLGSIFFVDLRLMGFISRDNPVRRASRILPVTWVAFAVAVVTGILLYLPAASRYTWNFAFQIKFLLLALAGINMLVFHYGIWRTVDAWDQGPPPAAARTAGFLSAALWLAVVYYGRLTPFVG
jgi:hypothetical protein